MFHSAVTIANAFAARHPGASQVESISAAADTKLDSVQAMAFKGYSATAGELVTVKATEHFYVAGEFIAAGDVVEVQKSDFTTVLKDKARLATDDEIAAAKKGK